MRDADPRIGEFLRSVVEPGALADTCAYSPDLTFEQRVELLETLDVVERLQLALTLQRNRLAERRSGGASARTSNRGSGAARIPCGSRWTDPQGARRGRRR